MLYTNGQIHKQYTDHCFILSFKSVSDHCPTSFRILLLLFFRPCFTYSYRGTCFTLKLRQNTAEQSFGKYNLSKTTERIGQRQKIPDQDENRAILRHQEIGKYGRTYIKITFTGEIGQKNKQKKIICFSFDKNIDPRNRP